MRDLEGRTAIVTGASRGLGAEIARALAARGVHLALAARSAGEMDALAAELRVSSRRIVVVPTDLSRDADLARLVATARAELGEIDILVNNAGIERILDFRRIPPADIERIVRVNLVATMLLTQLVVTRMVERRTGHVVNVASLAGKMYPSYNVPYVASKAGVVGFTKSLRAELRRHGVGVSAVCPGFVGETGMFARHRRQPGVGKTLLAGESTPRAVADAVVRCIIHDVPEILVNPSPARLLTTLAELSPPLGAWVMRALRLEEPFARAAAAYAAGSAAEGARQTQ